MGHLTEGKRSLLSGLGSFFGGGAAAAAAALGDPQAAARRADVFIALNASTVELQVGAAPLFGTRGGPEILCACGCTWAAHWAAWAAYGAPWSAAAAAHWRRSIAAECCRFLCVEWNA